MKTNMIKKISTVGIAAYLLCGSVAHATAMLGSYVEKDGWEVAAIDEWNTAAKKKMAIINLFTTFDDSWESLKFQSDNILSRKAVPMISWMPVSPSLPNAKILTEIVAGQWDAYIDEWIQGFKSWRSTAASAGSARILLRFGHEFNGRWYPWGNDPQNFIAAWRHVHDRFELAGVNPYVEWVWCANNADVDDVKDITKYYPGDTYVDWTGLDGYNWGSNFSFSKWKSFDETFSSPYNKLINNYPTKPIVIAEIGVAEPSDVPNPAYGQDGDDSDKNNSKEAWVNDMFARIEASYPAIGAITWFNINKELSWALHKPNNTGLNAYRRNVRKPYYQSTFTQIAK